MVVRSGLEPDGGLNQATARQRKLVRRIEALTRGRLVFEGRRYRLVSDVDLTRLPDRDSYEVVSHTGAVRILSGLAGTQNGSPELAAALGEARGPLSPDWRAPFSPNGVVLLRRIMVVQPVRPATDAPLTPSQLKELMKPSDWIEIEVVDDEDQPHIGPYRLVLTDGTTVEGTLGQDGSLAKYEIESGNCKLVLLGAALESTPVEDFAPEEVAAEEEASPAPEVPPAIEEPPSEELPTLPDGLAEAVALEASLTFELVDEEGNILPNRRFELECADGSTRENASADGELRFEDIPPGECVLRLLPTDAPRA